MPDNEPTLSFGHVFCFHRRYYVGDQHDHVPADFDGWGAFRVHLIRQHRAAVIVPVWMYEHSGIRVKVGSFAGLLPEGHARFDTHQVGWAFATRSELRRKLGHTYDAGDPADVAAAVDALTAAVSSWDDRLQQPDLDWEE